VSNGNFTATSSDSGIDIPDDEQDSSLQSNGADALDHPNAERIDWQRIATVVRRPRLVFDGRNVVDCQKLARLGFIVENVGKANVF
jgi:UDPglucose 6-dehydrogenase